MLTFRMKLETNKNRFLTYKMKQHNAQMKFIMMKSAKQRKESHVRPKDQTCKAK